LFAFFVVLYASSQVDKRKVGKLALAIQVAFQEMGVFQSSTTQVPVDAADPMPFSTAQAIENTERTASLGRIASRPDGSLGSGVENGDLAELQTELETALAGEIKRQEIAMRREPDGLVISLREVGFFESGSALMKPTSQAAFDRIADLLRKREYRLRIEGHTDNVPIHTAQFPSNWEALHIPRNRNRAAPYRSGRVRSRSSERGWIRRLSPRRNQSHCGRPWHEPPRRYSDPRARRHGGQNSPSRTRSPDPTRNPGCRTQARGR
jgi:hypothetical protein